MSVKTVEDLFDTLNEELAWRRQELSSLKALIEQGNMKETRRKALLRSGVTLLYAHWEGFIKIAGRAYLEFVALQKLQHQELASNFIAISIRSLLNTAAETSQIGKHKEVTEFFLNDLHTRCNLPYKNVINTKSNLSSKIFKDIVDTLGLDYAKYTTKSFLIDEKLLNKRNTIAHGNYIAVDVKEYRELHEFVLQTMETFRTQIDNAASLGSYRASRN